MVMDLNKRLELAKRNAHEIITEKGLEEIFEKKAKPVVYCGYECSGEIHAGHLVTITKLLDLQRTGCKIKVLFADWHTWLNRKGDWDFIHEQVNLWKRGFRAAGLTTAQFILGSSFERKINYIDDVLKMSLRTTLNRALRSMQVVARDIEHAHVSQMIYPLMQLSDIKYLKLDLVVAGLDQRKIHALGIDGMFKEINYKIPVFIHTPIITSLRGPGSKMSSSDPISFVSIRDSDDNINDKIKRAYCPEGVIEDNPVLQLCKLIIFPRIKNFKVERDKKYGGDLVFNDYDKLEKLFVNKELHPQDLKNSTSKYLSDIVGPIRKNFQK